MKCHTFPKLLSITSINDLSDNGKKFEFGYDSEADSYGYYKDGIFTQFGGGGLNTNVVIKAGIFVKNGGYNVCIINEDLSIYNGTSMTSASTTTLCNFINEHSTLVTAVSGGSYKITFTVLKDGYYLGHAIQTPSYLNAGDTIVTPSNWYGNGYETFLIYMGIQLPS